MNPGDSDRGPQEKKSSLSEEPNLISVETCTKGTASVIRPASMDMNQGQSDTRSTSSSVNGITVEPPNAAVVESIGKNPDNKIMSNSFSSAKGSVDAENDSRPGPHIAPVR